MSSIFLDFISGAMHKEILTENQVKLLPLVKSFHRDFYLVGGTAIALHLGHRRSIDFDLFTEKKFDNGVIRKKIRRKNLIQRIVRDQDGQFTVVALGTYMTFFEYPFIIPLTDEFTVVRVPDLLTLAAMKAYALGRRSKWKDYVDLYFVMRECHGIEAIVNAAKKIFGAEFNEKLFRGQVSYFADINYSEEVIYMPGFAVSDATVKKNLVKFSIE